jgi:hypothetical protein
LDEALEGGTNVKGVSFVVAEEVVVQGQLGITSCVAMLLSDVL